MKKLLPLLLVTTLLTFSGNAFPEDQGGDSAGDPAVARLQVKISELEEQIRRLQGLIEQNGFENKQVKSQLEKLGADMDYRLGALEKRPAQPSEARLEGQSQAAQPSSDILQPVAPSPIVENIGKLPKFATPLEHYNYAFNLVREKKYAESGTAFTAFTAAYPKDPLIGNAWYWLGETYYVRHDYVKAADSFRQGYEAMPTGPKAADNLLKLAMSMNLLKKDREACIVLKQITVKFAGAGNMKSRAAQEMKAIGCGGNTAPPAAAEENEAEE